MSVNAVLVQGYIRTLQKSIRIHIPNDILLIIALFFPNVIEFDGCKMELTDDEKEMISKWLSETICDANNPVLCSTLLYDPDMDGKTASDFHRRCDDHQNLFGMVKIKDSDHIIGFFVSQSFNENDPKEGTLIGNYVNDDKVFLCVMRSSFKDKGPEIFRVKAADAKYAYFNAQDWLPNFGYSDELVINGIDEGGYCRTPDESCFEPRPIGNIFAGGNEYSIDQTWEFFDIETMQIFAITV